MVGENLETNGGVVLVPVCIDVEDFDAGMESGVGELLNVVIDDVGD